MYLSGDRRLREAATHDGRCTPILLLISPFQIVLGGTSLVYEVDPEKKSMFGSLSVSCMEQVVGMFCMERRGGEMGDGGTVLCLFVRIGE